MNKVKGKILIFQIVYNLRQDPDLDLDWHQNGKSDSDPIGTKTMQIRNNGFPISTKPVTDLPFQKKSHGEKTCENLSMSSIQFNCLTELFMRNSGMIHVLFISVRSAIDIHQPARAPVTEWSASVQL